MGGQRGNQTHEGENVYKEEKTEHAQIQIKTVEAQMIQFKYRHYTYIQEVTIHELTQR